jgi:hypothetical protein
MAFSLVKTMLSSIEMEWHPVLNVVHNTDVHESFSKPACGVLECCWMHRSDPHWAETSFAKCCIAKKLSVGKRF